MIRYLFIFAVLLLWSAAPAQAQPSFGGDNPYEFVADQLTFDEQAQVITAYGDVEIEQDGYIIIADTIQYDLTADRVMAIGDVQMLMPSGETIYTDYIELQEDLKKGFIDQLKITMKDGSRFAAKEAVRVDGNKKVLRGAVFSPCKVCEDFKGDKNLIWKLKAEKITHDEEKKDVIYRNAWLEFLDVPVLYTPYFSHPDPTVKRRSGFLTPSYGTSGSRGTMLTAPYYYEIDNHKDLLVEPMYFSKDGVITFAEFRQNLPNGKIRLAGSGGRVDKRVNANEKREKTRWHINSEGEFDLSEKWRTSFHIRRASDKTYLRRYEFSGDDIVTSTGQAEYFDDTDYGAIRAYYFQGLRPDDKDEDTLQVLPQIEYHQVDNYRNLLGRFNYSFESINLERDRGTDSRRTSLEASYSLPLYGAWGQVVDLDASLRGDLYHLNDTPNPLNASAQNIDGFESRILPVASATWRWPFVRQGVGSNQLIEPIAAFVAAPNAANNDIIPNEDSQAFEFDETNLFSTNRFPGVDRVTTGQRVDYGIKLGHFVTDGIDATFFIGQSYRLKEDDIYAQGSGLEDNESDLVGKAEIVSDNNYDIVYRFRANPESGDFPRNELSLNSTFSRFNLNLDYISIDDTANLSEIDDREEVTASLRTRLTDYWSLINRVRRDLKADSTRNAGIGLEYLDECFRIAFSFTRDFTDDGETEPSNTFAITFGLRYLGGEGFKE